MLHIAHISTLLYLRHGNTNRVTHFEIESNRMDIKRIESFVNSIDFLNACNALELHQLCVRLELCIWHRRRIVLYGPPPLSSTHSLITSIRNVYFQYSKYNPVMKCARAKGRPHYEYTLFFFFLLHLIYAFLYSLLILCSIQCGIMCKWNVDQVNGRHFYFFINEKKMTTLLRRCNNAIHDLRVNDMAKGQMRLPKTIFLLEHQLLYGNLVLLQVQVLQKMNKPRKINRNKKTHLKFYFDWRSLVWIILQLMI